MNIRRPGKLVITLAALTALSIAACGGEQKTAHPPTVAQTTVSPGIIKRVSPTVGVSEDLALACKLQMGDVTSAPKFDFDKIDLPEADRAVLAKVAECLTNGPLKGRSVKLVGRADPRGETQYNMSLGAHRANGVADHLGHLGVERTRLGVTSRGELDASGSDEAGWQSDRRVDIVLAQVL